MSATELYEQTIKPLSQDDKLILARLILNDVAPKAEPTEPEYGFEYLKRILPTIERITLTDKDLANVTLNGPITE